VAQLVCFTCGCPVGEPYKLNRLDNDQICPSCRDRVLDSLPPVLPRAPVAEPVELEPVIEPIAEDLRNPSTPA